jgi:hypothetical protein
MVSTNKYREKGKSLRRADLAANPMAIFEFKKVFDMPIGRLQQLHGTIVEVELEIEGSLRSITGQGKYDAKDPDLGSVLRILVSDPSGDFEFLIPESSWSGRLESSDIPGCNYRISLSTCTPC